MLSEIIAFLAGVKTFSPLIPCWYALSSRYIKAKGRVSLYKAFTVVPAFQNPFEIIGWSTLLLFLLIQDIECVLLYDWILIWWKQTYRNPANPGSWEVVLAVCSASLLVFPAFWALHLLHLGQLTALCTFQILHRWRHWVHLVLAWS